MNPNTLESIFPWLVVLTALFTCVFGILELRSDNEKKESKQKRKLIKGLGLVAVMIASLITIWISNGIQNYHDHIESDFRARLRQDKNKIDSLLVLTHSGVDTACQAMERLDTASKTLSELVYKLNSTIGNIELGIGRQEELIQGSNDAIIRPLFPLDIEIEFFRKIKPEDKPLLSKLISTHNQSLREDAIERGVVDKLIDEPDELFVEEEVDFYALIPDKCPTCYGIQQIIANYFEDVTFGIADTKNNDVESQYHYEFNVSPLTNWSDEEKFKMTVSYSINLKKERIYFTYHARNCPERVGRPFFRSIYQLQNRKMYVIVPKDNFHFDGGIVLSGPTKVLYGLNTQFALIKDGEYPNTELYIFDGTNKPPPEIDN